MDNNIGVQPIRLTNEKIGEITRKNKIPSEIKLFDFAKMKSKVKKIDVSNYF